MKTRKEYINYLIADLTRQIIKSDIKFDVVVGIANGGLHISIPIAKSLQLPHKSVRIQTYGSNKTKTHIKVENIDYIPQLFKNPLLVDDIVDTGATIELYKEYFGPATIATLYCKNSSNIIPDFYVRKTNQWIEFPWE